MKTTYTSLMMSGLICLAGCANNPTVATTATPALSPTVAPSPATPQAGGLRGVVAERLEVPSYTYLRISGPTGDTWAAVPTTSVPVGATVTITNPMPMHQFQSKTLKRTFEVIMFGSSAEVEAAPAPTSSPTPGA